MPMSYEDRNWHYFVTRVQQEYSKFPERAQLIAAALAAGAAGTLKARHDA